MNCAEVRNSLAGLLYGDLQLEQKGRIEKHLAECHACRQEHEALGGVRRLLDQFPVPDIRIDLGALYQKATELQQRRVRRWRRLALGFSAAAAVLAVLAGSLRFDLRLERQQLVLRWGAPPVQTESRAERTAGEIPPSEPGRIETADDQRQVLGELIRALADTVQTLERQQREENSRLQARAETLHQQDEQRLAAIERNVDALYILFKRGE